MICQLISHHSIIFKPDELKFWISTNPYQLGKYVCYDLDSVFSVFPGMKENREIYEEELSIPADSFMFSVEYHNFERYRELKEIIKKATNDETYQINDVREISELIDANSEYFYVYQLAGDYYFEKGDFKNAKHYYKLALTKEITTVPERREIEECLKEISIKD